jgi:hypothetical protein
MKIANLAITILTGLGNPQLRGSTPLLMISLNDLGLNTAPLHSLLKQWEFLMRQFPKI